MHDATKQWLNTIEQCCYDTETMPKQCRWMMKYRQNNQKRLRNNGTTQKLTSPILYDHYHLEKFLYQIDSSQDPDSVQRTTEYFCRFVWLVIFLSLLSCIFYEALCFYFHFLIVFPFCVLFHFSNPKNKNSLFVVNRNFDINDLFTSTLYHLW